MNGRSWRIAGSSPRARRLAISALGVAATAALAVGVALAQPPAVHQVNDHWSAWDAPAPQPEGGQVYVIQRGDTLWALAARFYGDPHLWPQLWEQNAYILDAQWIYPGDPLVLPGAQMASTEGVAGPAISEEPGVGMPSTEDPYLAEPVEDEAGPVAGEIVDTSGFSSQPDSGTSEPIPLGFESDIYCTGYVGDLDEEFPYRIASSEYEFMTPSLDPAAKSEVKGLWGKTDTVKYLLGVGDIVYIDGGRADGLSAGMVLVAIDAKEKMVHPVTKKIVGRLYHYTARVRVLSAQEETAIGEIVAACDPLVIGARLRVFEPEPVPLERLTPLRPVNYPASPEEVANGATIIAARDHIVALGTGHLVFIDRGSKEEVAPGDIFTIYRQGRRGFPPIVLGEAAILSVSELASLARIIRTRYTVYVGDSLVLK